MAHRDDRSGTDQEDRWWHVVWRCGDQRGTWQVKAPSAENARAQFYMEPMFCNGYECIEVKT
jgi:hypothetical protein